MRTYLASDNCIFISILLRKHHNFSTKIWLASSYKMRKWRPREVICPQVTQQRQSGTHGPRVHTPGLLGIARLHRVRLKSSLGSLRASNNRSGSVRCTVSHFRGKSNAQIWNILASPGTRKWIMWLLACKELACLLSPKGKVLSPHTADAWALRWVTNSQTSQSQTLFLFF